jgi:hypothetical protein
VVSAALAEAGYLTGDGKLHVTSAVQSMLACSGAAYSLAHSSAVIGLSEML